MFFPVVDLIFFRPGYYLTEQGDLIWFPRSASTRSYTAIRAFFTTRKLQVPAWEDDTDITKKTECTFFEKTDTKYLRNLIRKILLFEKRSGKMFMLNKFRIGDTIGNLFTLQQESHHIVLHSIDPNASSKIKPQCIQYFCETHLKILAKRTPAKFSSCNAMYSFVLVELLLAMESYSQFKDANYSWITQIYDKTISPAHWFSPRIHPIYKFGKTVSQQALVFNFFF